jgi:tetratricopeptide (TPR) repeat protein
MRYVGVAVGVAALVIGLAISTGLYFKARRAEESSRAAAGEAEAAAEFLTSEVLTQGNMGTTPEFLTRVGDEIDARFAAQPRIAAELHYLVGHSYARMHDYSPAIAHLNRAIELAQPLDGAGAAPVLRSAAELIQIDEAQGHLKDTLPRYETLLAAAQGHVVPGDAAFLELERQVELGRRRLGDLK